MQSHHRATKKKAAKAAKMQQSVIEPEAPVPDVVSNDQSSLYETWQSLQDHIQDMYNPWSKENGESLFQEPLQNHENPFNVNKVNPLHLKYGYYMSLISDLQAWNKYMDSVISDPEDDTSENDRQVRGKRESSWKKPCVHGPFDNKPDSYAYDYHRHVTNLQSTTNTNKKQLLTQVLSSIGSNVDKIHSVIASECVNCVKCKISGNTNLMADSSTSVHITMNRSDLSELKMASVLIQHPRPLNP